MKLEENNLKAKFVTLMQNLPDSPCQCLSVSLMKKQINASKVYQNVADISVGRLGQNLWGNKYLFPN